MSSTSWLSEYQQKLVFTGMSLGLAHVLAGPDHLSALAALAVGTSYKSFVLGFRWGLGHSTGLLVVAAFFIALKGDLDLRRLGRYCDSLVGLFMIFLGCYGVLSALRSYREKKSKRDRDCSAGKSLRPSSSFSSVNNVELLATTSASPSDKPSHLLSTTYSTSVRSISQYPWVAAAANCVAQVCLPRNHSVPDDEYHHHHHHSELDQCSCVNMQDPGTQRILSFVIGLLHGVAGPGGVLGVLPAVEMQHFSSSFLYLGSFILASTLSMGTFAALYGELTRRVGVVAESVDLGLSLLSSGLSVAVGVVWFVFSLLGKLEDMFH